MKVLLIHEGILQHMRGLVNRSDLPHIQTNYDTAFELVNGFYVSSHWVKYEEFKEGPAILVGVLLHERKTTSSHRLYFDGLTQKFPQIQRAENFFMVTDDEAAFISQILKYLPNIDLFRCWNHIKTNVKEKLRTLGLTNPLHVARYQTDIHNLFSEDSLTDYYRESRDYLQTVPHGVRYVLCFVMKSALLAIIFK